LLAPSNHETPWYIVSALHGLVEPERPVATYELRIEIETQLDERARSAVPDDRCGPLQFRRAPAVAPSTRRGVQFPRRARPRADPMHVGSFPDPVAASCGALARRRGRGSLVGL
jgi:hypothetical protein